MMDAGDVTMYADDVMQAPAVAAVGSPHASTTMVMTTMMVMAAMVMVMVMVMLMLML